MSGDQGIMRIGEVHAQLRKYFPDIELSKIRYYEDKGLVQPSRSRKGYRLYSERDVNCLREAIRLAQEEFVPLRVVRLRSDRAGSLEGRAGTVESPPRRARGDLERRVDSRAADDAQRATGVEGRTAERRRSGVERRALPSTMSEFLGATGLAPDVMTQLHALGLLAPVLLGNEIAFTDFDVRVAALAQTLLERGLDVRLLGSLRRVAEREIGLLDDLSAPLRSKASGLSGEQAHDVTVELAAEVAALRAVLYERALQDYLGR